MVQLIPLPPINLHFVIFWALLLPAVSLGFFVFCYFLAAFYVYLNPWVHTVDISDRCCNPLVGPWYYVYDRRTWVKFFYSFSSILALIIWGIFQSLPFSWLSTFPFFDPTIYATNLFFAFLLGFILLVLSGYLIIRAHPPRRTTHAKSNLQSRHT